MPPHARELADFFDDSFRALKPDKLSASILDLCREIVCKTAEDGNQATKEESDLVGTAAKEAARWDKP